MSGRITLLAPKRKAGAQPALPTQDKYPSFYPGASSLDMLVQQADLARPTDSLSAHQDKPRFIIIWLRDFYKSLAAVKGSRHWRLYGLPFILRSQRQQ